MFKFLKYYWWKILCSIIFIYFCYGAIVYFNMPDKDSFIVLDKIEQQAIKSTGKYSSELVVRTFIRIQYENGDLETITFDDPFVSRSYVINQKYIQNETHIFFHDYNMFAFAGWLFGWCTFGCWLAILWVQGFEKALRSGI